ncbi:MAG: hypothetical protein AB7L41_10745 [Flavobacteriaceae bacterium]
MGDAQFGDAPGLLLGRPVVDRGGRDVLVRSVVPQQIEIGAGIPALADPARAAVHVPDVVGDAALPGEVAPEAHVVAAAIGQPVGFRDHHRPDALGLRDQVEHLHRQRHARSPKAAIDAT